MPLILNGTTGVSGIDGSAGTPSYQGGDTNTGIFYPAADTIAFAEGGAEIARFDSSGNLGINNTSPAVLASTTQVAIKANVNGNSLFVAQNSNGLTTAKFGFQFTGSVDNPVIGSSTNHPLVFLTNDTERMRITSSGDVGIGTSSPSRKLTVIGKAQFTSLTASNEIYLSDSSTSTIDNQGIGCIGNDIRLIAGGSERLRITSGGLVGIGLSDPTTFSSGVAQAVIERTSAGNNTVALALVNRSGTANTSVSLDFNPNTNIALAQIRAFRTDTGFGGATDFRFLNYDGSALAERMRITSDGIVRINNTANATYNTQLNVYFPSTLNAGIHCRTNTSSAISQIIFGNATNNFVGDISTNGSATAYNTSSDYRLKENIAPMTGALDKVSQLKPVTYKWKVDGSAGQGFIAHELQAVIPDAVTGEKDAVDENGNPRYQGVDTSYLVATLTAAIQEQQAMIEELKAKVAALEK